MKRRIAVLLAGALMASMLALLPAAPASANSADVCAGVGTANTPALQYPIGAYNSGNFNFSLTTGLCVVKGLNNLSATGTLGGYCGLSAGVGDTHNGHHFYYVGLGGLLVITGEVLGVVLAAPNAVANQSCLSGATNFIIAGAAVKLPPPCRIGVSVTVPPLPGTPSASADIACP